MSFQEEINRLRVLASLPNDPMVACDPKAQAALKELVAAFSEIIPPDMQVVQVLSVAAQFMATLIRLAPCSGRRIQLTKNVCELIQLNANTNTEWG